MDRQKLVMVVGGSRGIGRTVSALLAHSYSNVAILYRADHRAAEEAAELVRREGANPVLLQADICDADAVAQQIADLSQSFGSLDGVVHSAGANSDWKAVRDEPGTQDHACAAAWQYRRGDLHCGARRFTRGGADGGGESRGRSHDPGHRQGGGAVRHPCQCRRPRPDGNRYGTGRH